MLTIICSCVDGCMRSSNACWMSSRGMKLDSDSMGPVLTLPEPSLIRWEEKSTHYEALIYVALVFIIFRIVDRLT